MFGKGMLTFLLVQGTGIFLSAFAQDRIITVSDDTIQCKINRISGKSIYFTQSSGVVKTKSNISRKDVKLWQISEPERIETGRIVPDQPHERWRVSLSAGAGYRISSTKEARKEYQNQGIPSSEIDPYFRQIKTGIKASGQVHYMFWKNYGLGIDYQFHNSSGSFYGSINPGDTYTLVYGKFTDNIFTNYTGLSLYMQQWINSKLKFFGQISSGLTLFREESVIVYSPLLITGKAYGGNTELGLEYFVGKKIALTLSTGLFQSTVSKITVNNSVTTQDVKLGKEQMEGLSRIDMGAGVRFHF